MKKFVSLAVAALVLILPIFSPVKLQVKAATEVLKVYNWEDYISEETQTVDGKEKTVTLYQEFEQYMKEIYNRDVSVEYSTFGTNEQLYNELIINKNNANGYDLVCPSDYMIEKLRREGLIQKINIELIPDYLSGASGYIKQLFDDNNWTEYAVPYMWGTMGYVYNPDLVNADDIQNWSALWNIEYKNKSTLKDSVRDTYFLGLAYVYRAELNNLADQLKEMTYKHSREDAEFIAFYNDYREQMDIILNRRDEQTIKKVESALKAVKENIFMFELDSGKNDMVTGKVSINFAWSGDAIFAMDQAEESGVYLNYAVPRQGSNVWFDGWVVPANAKNTESQINLRYEFLNFLSRADNAQKNMSYIGYTSPIAGQPILDWVKETYQVENFDQMTEQEIEQAILKGELFAVDLRYFFDNVPDINDAIVYTDTLGRQFSAQYPDQDIIDRCVIMQHFTDSDLEAVHQMWGRVKGNAFPVWAIIVIIAGIIAIAGGVATFVLLKKRKFKTSRKKLTVVKKG